MEKFWWIGEACQFTQPYAALKNILKKLNIGGGNGLKAIPFSLTKAHLLSACSEGGLLACFEMGEK